MHIFGIYIVYTFFIVFRGKYAMTDQSQRKKASKKDSQLLIRISSAERDQFIDLCDELDTSAARELRKFIRSFIKKRQSTDMHNEE